MSNPTGVALMPKWTTTPPNLQTPNTVLQPKVYIPSNPYSRWPLHT